MSRFLTNFSLQLSFQVVLDDIKELINPAALVKCVSEAINKVIEKKSSERERCSKLFAELINQNVLTLEQFRSG